MYLVGYNSRSKSYRLWDPEEPLKITNSAEVSFRERESRDVVKPKAGHDPFPVIPTMTYQPGLVEDEIKEEEKKTGAEPQLRRSSRPRKTRDILTMHTHTEEAYTRTEHALLTGSVLGNIGTGRPGEVGYMPADPANYDEAVNGPDGDLWKGSMRDEGQSLRNHDVFDWVDPPDGANLIPSKFLTKWKYNSDGAPVRPKSRVVAQGFHEADTGADKASPVASMEAVHLVFTIAAYYGLVVRQADIKTAFLHARIPDGSAPTYVIPPKGFECTEEQAKKVWRLKAWLYGLRLSPKGWSGTFHEYLLEMGFVQSTADPCLYVLNAGEVILLVYVDDILLTGTDEQQVSTTIELLKERFETVDLGDVKFLLGMAIERDIEAGTIRLTQEAYTKAVLAKFGMNDAHSTTTPAEVGQISAVEEEMLSPEDTKMFRSATGSLLYICRGSRPDISHAVFVLTKSMANPGPKAMVKLKRLLRYLKGTTSIGITYSEDADGGDRMSAYVDSDFAGDVEDRRSQTGVVLCFGGGPVDWRSTKQTVVALSSTEAEYVAMSKACTMVLHFRHLLDTVHLTQEEATLMYEDSTGAISTSQNDRITPRTKHIDVKYHHTRSLVADGVVEVIKIGTAMQKADMLTKSLGPVKFKHNRVILLGM